MSMEEIKCSCGVWMRNKRGWLQHKSRTNYPLAGEHRIIRIMAIDTLTKQTLLT